MEKFKIGDKVKIREWDDMVEDFGMGNYGCINTPILFAPAMRLCCGKTMTIERITEDYTGWKEYRTKESDKSWCDEMFEDKTYNKTRARGFEKISQKQAGKETIVDGLYNGIILPHRKTKYSAGYDIHSLYNLVLMPKKTVVIPTGIKAYMQDDEVLKIYVRSSLGFKYNVVLSNSTGIVDSDYYSNPSNDGHIFIKLINHGDKPLEISRDDAIAQGIFVKYLTVDNDNLDEGNERIGGIGSTNK